MMNFLCLGTVYEHHGYLTNARKDVMPTPEDALPVAVIMPVTHAHTVLGNPLEGPFDPSLEVAMFGLGCFWGAERVFWKVPGVFTTAVGYAAGYTPNPTYREVCSGQTGHNEVVLVVFDPAKVSFADLLKVFWESHDPTQGMRQGNDMGRNTARVSTPILRLNQKRRRRVARSTTSDFRQLATTRSQPKSLMHPSFTTLRSITSNTLIRTPRVLLVLAEQALPAVSERASALKRVRVRALRTRRYQH